MSVEVLFIEESVPPHTYCGQSLIESFIEHLLLILLLYLYPDTVAFKARKKKPWNLTEEMGLRRVRQQLARGARPPIPHCDKTPDYLDAIRRGRRTGDPTEYRKSRNIDHDAH